MTAAIDTDRTRNAAKTGRARRAQRLGRLGESVAAEELERRGFRIRARNVRTPYGELDLVADDETSTVIVEVKTRSSLRMGLPAEAVGPRKRARLIASAQHFLQNLGLLGNPWRIDVAAVTWDSDRQCARIEIIENAVHG